MKHAHYGRVLRPFVRFLEKSGIVAHYSMHGDTLQNKMSERHKHTLIYIYIVKGMISYSTLLISLWMETLKNTAHILN